MKKNEKNTKNSNNMNNYSNPQDYSDAKLWSKIAKCATKMGAKLVYYVLILYYVMKEPGVPLSTKAEIAGALAYVIIPVDLIPDFIPVAGYTDDMAAVVAALKMVSSMVTPEIERKAKDKVRGIFGTAAGCDFAA